MKHIILLWLLILTVGCGDVLDKNDPNAINESDVWADEALTLGFLNEIYDESLPGWPINSSGITDNAVGINSVMYGERISNEVNIYGGTYNRIRKINVLLDLIDTGGLDAEFTNTVKAQALVFRAWNYFNLVSTYGGVPLILESKSLDDDLNIPRNSTSECMAQIIADLDAAIQNLPSTYSDAEYGRITKGAAMALKGRFLLHYASEQFDPSQSGTNRWQDAMNANKAALDELDAQGKGLATSFSDFWFDESSANSEAILIRKYTIDKHTNRDVGVRPFVVGTNGESWDKPVLDFVAAFPMKDGKSITDPTSTYEYDETIYWINRDPRFNATLAYNGSMWDINDPEPLKTSPVFWTFQGNRIESQANDRISPTAIYCRKAVDNDLSGGPGLYLSTTDWIEIRYTEVLMNYAEAANEVGQTDIAMDILMQVRERAGIENNDGTYGLKAGMSQDEMREAILLERRIEFAYEGKRADDLRRRRLYHTINGNHRRGYIIETTSAFDALHPSDEVLDDRQALEALVINGSVDLDDPATYTTYFTTSIRSVERDGNTMEDGAVINYMDQYYFYDLPQSAMDKNPALVQTQGWPGGSFDPLQ